MADTAHTYHVLLESCRGITNAHVALNILVVNVKEKQPVLGISQLEDTPMYETTSIPYTLGFETRPSNSGKQKVIGIPYLKY